MGMCKLKGDTLIKELADALGGLIYYVTMGELDSERFLRDYESYLETFCKTQEVLVIQSDGSTK